MNSTTQLVSGLVLVVVGVLVLVYWYFNQATLAPPAPIAIASAGILLALSGVGLIRRGLGRV